MITEEAILRVMMFPWPSHGHISPFLELAKKLSTKNFHIYFCSTPINLDSIKNRIDSLSSSSVELVEFHLPASPELPPHYHTANGLPPHLHKTLLRAFNMSKPNFSDILNNLKPNLLIYDTYQPWVPEIASSHHIPAVNFHCSGAASSCFFYSNFLLQGEGLQFNFPAIYLRESEIRKMIASAPYDAKEAAEDPIYSCVEKSFDFVLVKSCRAIEDKYINFFSQLFNKKMVTVGPLSQSGEEEEEEEEEEEKDSVIMEWLSQKGKSSTAFVSFGSENYLCNKKMEELAYGLELSNVNFIWVIRFPSGG